MRICELTDVNRWWNHRKMLGLVVAVTALVLSVTSARPVQAATRFVATTGSNLGLNNCLSSGSPCKTITYAMSQAAASDTVQVTAGTYNTALGESFPLGIGINLTITGAGAVTTIVDAGGSNRVFDVTGGTVGLSGLTIRGGGNVTQGAGIRNSAGATLTVTDVTIDANTATASTSNGSAATARGGGIYNLGTLTLLNTALTYNRVEAATTAGGAATAQGIDLYNAGDGGATLTNVTTDKGTAYASSTGPAGPATAQAVIAQNSGDASMVLTNVTLFLDNMIAAGSPTTVGPSMILNSGGSVTIKNTIVTADCGGIITSAGHNMTDSQFTGASCGFNPGLLGDHYGSVINLGALALNPPGTTPTRALPAGHGAIDTGDNTGCPATDQRGVARPQGTTCDVGAYEYYPAIPTLSEWAQIGMAALLVGGGLLALRRNRQLS